MATSSPPTLLLAARSKWIGSASYAELAAAGVLGTSDAFPVWAFYGLEPSGFPTAYGHGRTAVTFDVRGTWNVSRRQTLTYPILRVSVWSDTAPATDAYGDPLTTTDGSGQWNALTVASALVSEFHDPANSHNHHWSPDVYVLSCLWNGDQITAETETKGLWRSDLSFELEVP